MHDDYWNQWPGVILGAEDDDGNARQMGQQLKRLVEVDFKSAQVAVVDAKQRGGEAGAFGQLALVVHFQQYRHAQLMGEGFEAF